MIKPIKKICTRCKNEKGFDEFYVAKRRKDGLSGWCKDCCLAHRSNIRNQKCGITHEQYNELFEHQKGCCAVCGTHQSGLKRSLNADHNHKTGEMRGLLCGSCNRALGFLKEDPKRIKALLEYVYRYNISIYKKSG